jgi:DNA-binding MarR family transcriptional regulator
MEQAPAPVLDTVLPPSMGNNAGYLLFRAFVRMQAIFIDAFRGELHPRELTLIARLIASGGSSQQELADCMSVNRSMMVHVIDELEGRGLVVRERNASDRRAYVLGATEAGAKLLESAGPTLRAADAIATGRLGETQRERLRELLTELLGPKLPEVAAPVAGSCAFLIARSHFALHASADEALAPIGIEIREYATLQTIADIAPCSQQQVASMLGVSGPVVVELIDALEPRGLVVRERNPADRRSYALRLTAAGEELRAQAREVLRGIEREYSGRLSDGEQEELRELLRVLLGADG